VFLWWQCALTTRAVMVPAPLLANMQLTPIHIAPIYTAEFDYLAGV
jgi:hypothetical protein